LSKVVPERVAILGAGSWGTALALQLCRNGHAVRLWGHDALHISALRHDRENREFREAEQAARARLLVEKQAAAVEKTLRGRVTALEGEKEAVLRQLEKVEGQLARQPPPQTGQLDWMAGGGKAKDVTETLERDLGILSGPSFAAEVARGLPTAITVAASSPEYAQRFADLVRGSRFRAYTHDDLIGVEVGGAAKNVIAIATGIADGLGFGANTRAALITHLHRQRALLDLPMLRRLGEGRVDDGLGDLVRRHRCLIDAVGHDCAAAVSPTPGGIDAGRRLKVGGGAQSGRVPPAMAAAHGIDMPISAQVHAVLYEGSTPAEATQRLLERAGEVRARRLRACAGARHRQSRTVATPRTRLPLRHWIGSGFGYRGASVA